MPYIDDYYAGQEPQAAPAERPEYRAGRVTWGEDTPWYRGGDFTTNDVLPTAAAALGGLAGLARAGVKGLAWEGAQQVGKEALKDPAERMFDTGRNFIADRMPSVPAMLGGVAALGAGNAALASGPASDLYAWWLRQRGLGMEFPPATQAHPAYRGKERQ